MSESIWVSYAERRPTREDADHNNAVAWLRNDGSLYVAAWTARWHGTMQPERWARTADVLRATGYVKPRKLHSAWRGPGAADWDGDKRVWLIEYNRAGQQFNVHSWLDTNATSHYVKAMGLFWQPCDPPKVWEDE